MNWTTSRFIQERVKGFLLIHAEAFGICGKTCAGTDFMVSICVLKSMNRKAVDAVTTDGDSSWTRCIALPVIKEGETWAAVNKSPVKKGAEVTIENVMVMNNFESKSLKRTFPTIVFGTLGGTGASAPADGTDMTKAHSGLAKTIDAGDIHVPKASGPNARTVAEVVTKDADLKGQTVLFAARLLSTTRRSWGKIGFICVMGLVPHRTIPTIFS